MQVKLGITRLISFSCFSLDVEISHISGRCGFCCQSLIWDWLRFSRVPRTSVAAHGLDLSWEFWEAIHAKMFFCETTYQNHYSKSYFSKIANYLLFSNHGIQQWKGKPPRESTLAISAEGMNRAKKKERAALHDSVNVCDGFGPEYYYCSVTRPSKKYNSSITIIKGSWYILPFYCYSSSTADLTKAM